MSIITSARMGNWLVSHKFVTIVAKLNFVTCLSIKLFQATDFNGYQIRHYVVVRVSSDF